MNSNLLEGGQFVLGLATGFCVSILVVLTIDVLGLGIATDRALLGAIVGGLLAGFASLLATIVSNYYLLKSSLKSDSNRLESAALAAFSKIHDVRDTITKGYQHYFNADPRLSMFVSNGIENKRLPKPLKFSSILVKFEIEDSTFALSIKDVDFFNRINDVARMVGQYNALHLLYEGLFEKFERNSIDGGGVSLEGKVVQGEISVNKFEILAIEESRDHLMSFLWRARIEIAETHTKAVEVLKKFNTKVEYYESGTSAHAESMFA